MATWLKQSTAATIEIGPFVDDTDGKTAETALTLSQADIRLSKNGAAFAQKNDANAATHMEIGYYSCALNSTDTNTLGRLRLAVHESGALPVFMEFMVVPANVWDSLFGADKLQVDAVEWLGGTIATPTVTGVPEVDVTHVGGSAQAISTNLDATVSSRASQSSLNTVAGYIDTEVASILAAVDTEVASILSTVTTNLDATVSSRATPAQVNTEVVDVIRTDTNPEAYAADGAAGTIPQLLYAILACVSEFSISGTTITVKKLDGTTTAMTFTLNDASNPTSRTRAT